MYSKNDTKQCIYQGDIFQDFEYVTWIEDIKEDPSLENSMTLPVEVIQIPFFVILTQACDLKQDFNERNNGNEEKTDKIIQSVLVCPAYIAEEFRNGIHLSALGIRGEHYNNRRWNIITSNNDKRHHFLKGDSKIGLPDIVIDFKQYYTIPLERLYKLYKRHYLCSLKTLFREDLSHRFAFYLSRIGLPSLNEFIEA